MTSETKKGLYAASVAGAFTLGTVTGVAVGARIMHKIYNTNLMNTIGDISSDKTMLPYISKLLLSSNNFETEFKIYQETHNALKIYLFDILYQIGSITNSSGDSIAADKYKTMNKEIEELLNLLDTTDAKLVQMNKAIKTFKADQNSSHRFSEIDIL